MDDQNIKSTFSPKSDLTLAEIMKKNNLEGASVGFLLEKITMFFSRAEISEKEMTSLIQKETGVSQKIAAQIALEIKNTLIPTLWNNLSQEEKESLLHEKKVVVEETEETPKMAFSLEPPKKSAPPTSTVNKISDGPDSYRESIE